VGGLAASAPVNFYPGQHKQKQFLDAILYDLDKFGIEGCAAAFSSALAQVEEYGKSLTNRIHLAETFQMCSPGTFEKEKSAGKLLFYVKGAIATMAMLDYPYPCDFVTPMPGNPVNYGCKRMLNRSDSDVMSRLKGFIDVFLNYTGQIKCHDVVGEVVGGTARPAESGLGFGLGGLGNITRSWNYQACTELPLEPVTNGGEGFYPPDDSQLQQLSDACFQRYHVRPRGEWMPLTTGGGQLQDLTNVIFSDGEKDPWKVGGITKNLSSSVVHLLIPDAAHHQVLLYRSLWSSFSVLLRVWFIMDNWLTMSNNSLVV
jgi:hypothetical protein